MLCVVVAAACWLPPTPLQPLPPTPLQPLPPPPPLVRSEAQEHGWRIPPPPTVPSAVPAAPSAASPAATPSRSRSGSEQWRTLVAAWFGPRTDAALAVIGCESGGNPDAVNGRSGASGLFQHLPRYWPERSAAAGFAGADILDPEANVAVAAWLSGGGADWRHWTCGP